MKRTLIFLIVVMISFQPGSTAAEGPEAAAVASAKQWLSLVDSGHYSQSWKEAAAYFRGAVTQEQWKQMLEGVRSPMGRLISRKVKQTVFTKELPGAPDGEYVVILFETSFENKRSAIETVTPMKDPDSRWRVSGYYIK